MLANFAVWVFGLVRKPRHAGVTVELHRPPELLPKLAPRRRYSLPPVEADDAFIEMHLFVRARLHSAPELVFGKPPKSGQYCCVRPCVNFALDIMSLKIRLAPLLLKNVGEILDNRRVLVPSLVGLVCESI